MEEKPTVGQKIAKLIAESHFKNPLQFHREIEEKFGKDAIKLRRLYFIINYQGQRRFKDTVLYQIASTLKMEIYDLIQGTTSEPPTEGVSHGLYPYNKSTLLYNLYHGLPFEPQMIKMRSGGKTLEEYEEIPGFQCFKFVIVTRGEVRLVIKHNDGNVENMKLKLDERHCFNSSEPHYFENKSKQFTKILVIKFTKPT